MEMMNKKCGGPVETILAMLGDSGPTSAKIFDNTIIDKLVQEGFTDRLYNK
jgi:hypothetical protein